MPILGLGNTIFRRGSGAAWSPFLTLPDGLPLKDEAEDNIVFCLMQIVGDNFIDGINGWEFPITNKDWTESEGTWLGNISIFPFKTAATLSAPTDAGIKAQIIACDVNNFWYAADGSPNSIPVQAFFQNIDFANKSFCAHNDHVLNGNLEETLPAGVRYVTLYKSAQTIDSSFTDFFGADVTRPTSNATFVSKSGNDTTGDGSYANPWLTMYKALMTTTNNYSVWILSGIYAETGDVAGTPYDYLRFSRNSTTLNMKCAGNVQLSTTYYQVGTIVVNFTGLYFSNIIYNTAQPVIYTRLKFGSSCTCGNRAATTIKYCTSNGTWTNSSGTSTFTENYGLNGTVTVNFNNSATEITYCKFKTNTGSNNNGLAYGTALTGSTIKYNYFETNGTGYGLSVAGTSIKTSTHLATIERNIFKVMKCGIYLHPSDVSATSTFKAVVQYNQFIDLQTNATITAYGMDIASALFETSEFNCNYGYSDNIGSTTCFLITPTNINISFKINYNRFFHSSKAGAIVSFGEGATGAMDGTEIIGNLFSGYMRLSAYDVTAANHGLLVNGGKNYIVKYNRFENCALGIAFKTATGEDYTSGGLTYNVFYNNSAHFYLRRAGDVPVYGNTMFNSMAASYLNRVGALDDQAVAGSCRGTVFTNNIFCHNKTGASQIFFYVESTGIDGTDDILWDDNIFYADASVYAISDEVPNLYTYAQAVTNGWITNGEQATPVFNDGASGELWLQVGSAGRGDGTDLGATYDDGLDISTDWNNDPDDEDPDNYPTIVTKQQGASWDKGAYIH